MKGVKRFWEVLFGLCYKFGCLLFYLFIFFFEENLSFNLFHCLGIKNLKLDLFSIFDILFLILFIYFAFRCTIEIK